MPATALTLAVALATEVVAVVVAEVVAEVVDEVTEDDGLPPPLVWVLPLSVRVSVCLEFVLFFLVVVLESSGTERSNSLVERVESSLIEDGSSFE